MSRDNLTIVNSVLNLLSMVSVQEIKDTQVAQLISDSLDLPFKTLLSKDDWKFATRVEKLVDANVPSADIFPYTFAYTIPPYLLKITKIYDEKKIERRGLFYFSDQDEITIEFVHFDIPFRNLPNYFIDALAHDVAARLCLQITKDRVLTQFLEAKKEEKLSEAKELNNIEDSFPDLNNYNGRNEGYYE